MADGVAPTEWTGRIAVVSFPDRVDERLARRIGEQLLEILGQGARLVIADMSRTMSCDPACADTLIRVYHNALLKQAELRLVVSAADVARFVGGAGLDRLVSVFPTVQAAISDGPRDEAGSPGPYRQPQFSAAVLRQLIDALDDGILLAAADGTIVLSNRKLTSMFGYADGELTGQPVEALVPASLRMLHRKERSDYGQHPVARPMADRIRLVGLRKDGGTRPVTISLSPVPTAGEHFVLAVVRDATQAARRDDLASLAWAVADLPNHEADTLHDRVVSSLFHVGLSLQAAGHQPADVAGERIADALLRLDQVIHDVRDHLFRRGTR